MCLRKSAARVVVGPIWPWAAGPMRQPCLEPWRAFRNGSSRGCKRPQRACSGRVLQQLAGQGPDNVRKIAMSEEVAFVQVVDASGLTCPLPILRAKKALATIQSGEVLKIITTDRNAIRDFQAF